MTTEASLEVEVNENEQPKVQNEQVGTSIEQDQQGEEITAEKNESPENKNPEETATKSPSSPSSVGERSPGKQKKEREASEGKGISRFLPPWLKKQKSQSFSEPKEDDGKSKAEETVEPAKEDDSEGVKSGEDQPVETKLEEKEEKRSVSSAETQPAKEENKEEETQNVVEDKVENEGDVGKEEHVPKPAEPKKEIPLKSPKKLKTVPCKVTLLDGTEYSCDLEKRAKGQVLFVKVCDHLNLLETDYFGLTYRDNADQKNWLDPAKEIKRQIRSSPWLFSFNVKFYPPDPSQLTEDITRYFLCLQLRQDIASGRLPCSFVTHALLGSYTLQAELGDYDAEEHSIDYISDFQFAPNQTKEMEDKVMELHKTHRGLTPAQADIQFLENAKKLSMYGVDLHHAKDSEAVDIMLGVCANGLLIYKDRLRINRFAWPKILKISYKRSNFYIKVRPGELEQFESTIGFKLPNHRAAKRLWKVCVEHHTFYRLSSPEQPPKARFLTLGSKFRYSGRTQAQTREASTRIDRPAPYFERTSSKRVSRSLDGAPIGTISDQSLLKEPQVIEAGSAVDGRILSTEAFVQESMNGASSPESEEAQLKDTKSKSLRIEGANIYVRHSNLMLEDLDKSQDELLKHQASISELKRSFMESTPEPRPNEWEKRCITPLSLQTHGSSDEIQNIVEVKKQSECDNKETPLTEHIKTEENKEVDFPREANGEVQEVKQLDKKETDSVSSSDSSSDSENEEAEYQAQSRLSESVLREELEESAEDIQESQPEDESNVILVEDHTMTVKVTHSEEMTTLMTQEITYKVGENVFTEGHEAVEEEHNKINGDLSPVDEASAQIICCSEPPVVKTEMVTISDATQRTEISTKEVPIVQTETKTITFESPQLDGTRDGEPGVLLSAQTITSDSILTTTTTHITKTGKGGISETRIEKRIVISGDADIDHDEALAQAIKEAKEQHPDMSITRVVVHKETEVTEEGED
ncbi:band 4.1-like protein 2 isoform X2 [Spea bombifrons]|uniref:band 4.1-like protein 2 isoform X2 n=1 Tax=Spea bombifrons TaxID=233779 RepID=UPI0023498C64|nr:band 4.1-like protein 2 isoform X2 [Spea bombifrons]